MILSLISPENHLLTQPSKKIDLKDLKIGRHDDLIESMIRFACGEQTDQNKKILVGLSAPQVGILLRVILVDLAADGRGRTGDLHEFINPEITWASDNQDIWYEGCFSAGIITGIVRRPEAIKVKAFDRHGLPVSGEYSGYTARIFQHERDHLDGKRFPDLGKDVIELHTVEPGQWPDYRNGEAWRNWPHKATLDQWKKIRK